MKPSHLGVQDIAIVGSKQASVMQQLRGRERACKTESRTIGKFAACNICIRDVILSKHVLDGALELKAEIRMFCDDGSCIAQVEKFTDPEHTIQWQGFPRFSLLRIPYLS